MSGAMIGNRALSWGLSALATGTLVALVTTAASGEAQVAQAPVRVGVIGTLFRDTPEPMMQVMLRPLKSLMETQTGLTGQLVAGGDVGNLAGQLVNKKVQLAVFHGFEFAWARLKFPALKPLMIAVNQQRNPKAMLIVHRNSLATGFGDLHGKDIALARFTREYCRLSWNAVAKPAGNAPKNFSDALPTHPISTMLWTTWWTTSSRRRSLIRFRSPALRNANRRASPSSRSFRNRRLSPPAR